MPPKTDINKRTKISETQITTGNTKQPDEPSDFNLPPLVQKEFIKLLSPEEVMFLSSTIQSKFLSKTSDHSNEIWQYWTLRDCAPWLPDNFVQVNLNISLQEEEEQGDDDTSADLNLAVLNTLHTSLNKAIKLLHTLKEGDTPNHQLSNQIHTYLQTSIVEMERLQWANIDLTHPWNVFWTLVDELFKTELYLVNLHNGYSGSLKRDPQIHWKSVYITLRLQRDRLVAKCLIEMAEHPWTDYAPWVTALVAASGPAANLNTIIRCMNESKHGRFKQLLLEAVSSAHLPTQLRIALQNRILAKLPAGEASRVLATTTPLPETTMRLLINCITANKTRHIAFTRLWQFLADVMASDNPSQLINSEKFTAIINAFPDQAFIGILYRWVSEPHYSKFDELACLLKNIPRFHAELNRLDDHEYGMLSVLNAAEKTGSRKLVVTLFQSLDLAKLYHNRHLLPQPFIHWVMRIARSWAVFTKKNPEQLAYLESLPLLSLTEQTQDFQNVLHAYCKALLPPIRSKIDNQDQLLVTQYNPFDQPDDLKLFSLWLNRLVEKLPPAYIEQHLWADNPLLFRLAFIEKPSLILEPFLRKLFISNPSTTNLHKLTSILKEFIDSAHDLVTQGHRAYLDEEKRQGEIAQGRLTELQKVLISENITSLLKQGLPPDFQVELIMSILKLDNSQTMDRVWPTLVASLTPEWLFRITFITGNWSYIRMHLLPAHQPRNFDVLQIMRHKSEFTSRTLFHEAVLIADAIERSLQFISFSDFLEGMAIPDDNNRTALHTAAQSLPFPEFLKLITLFAPYQDKLIPLLLSKDNKNRSVMDIMCDRYSFNQLASLLRTIPNANTILVQETPALSGFVRNHAPLAVPATQATSDVAYSTHPFWQSTPSIDDNDSISRSDLQTLPNSP